jgi:hypothetical protein
MTPPISTEHYSPISRKAGGLDELPRLTKEADSLHGAVTDDVFAGLPWYQRVNWIHVTILFGTPVLALYGVLTTPMRWETIVWALFYYFVTGMGITAGACGRERAAETIPGFTPASGSKNMDLARVLWGMERG